VHVVENGCVAGEGAFHLHNSWMLQSSERIGIPACSLCSCLDLCRAGTTLCHGALVQYPYAHDWVRHPCQEHAWHEECLQCRPNTVLTQCTTDLICLLKTRDYAVKSKVLRSRNGFLQSTTLDCFTDMMVSMKHHEITSFM
jgi:hypothetical protein